MSRRVDEPVVVQLRDTRPVAFIWQGRRRIVREIVEEWQEAGRWWEGEGERRFVRLLTTDSACELYCHLPSGQWYLHRILD